MGLAIVDLEEGYLDIVGIELSYRIPRGSAVYVLILLMALIAVSGIVMLQVFVALIDLVLPGHAQDRRKGRIGSSM